MPSPNLHLTFRDGGTGDAGDPYTGLDRFGRLVETLWKQGGSDRVRSKYGRNQVGRVVWRRDEEAHAQGKNTQDNYYGYDGLQQVKQRQRGDLTGPAQDYTGVTNLQQEEDWTHDATGNWAAYSNTSPTNAQTHTHNPTNEITEISSSPGDVEPAYDPVGNMLTLPKEAGTSTEQYDLVWDAWNRLVAVKDGGTVVASYTYDGLTRRLTKTNAAEVRHYYYNAAWRALEERVEGASSEIDRQYTWGLRDRWDLLRRKRSTTGSLDEALYVLRDYLDPVAIVDDTGAVVERYAYDAFGNVRFLAPDYSDISVSGFDWDFLFHAEFRDTDTRLYNYGYRFYDTGLGRWLSRDLIGHVAGMNLVLFLENRPTDSLDLNGLIENTKFYSAFKGKDWKTSNPRNLDEYENYLHEIKVSVDTSGCEIREEKCCGSGSVNVVFKSTVSFIQGAAMWVNIRNSGLLVKADGEGPPRFFKAVPERSDAEGAASIRGNTYVATGNNAYKVPCEGRNMKKAVNYTMENDLQGMMGLSYIIDIAVTLSNCGSNGAVDFTLDFRGPYKPKASDRGLRELTGPNDPKRPPFR